MDAYYEIKVVNKYNKEIYENCKVVNIMRPSIFGNPFRGDRTKAILDFKSLLWKKVNEKGELYQELVKLAEESKHRPIILVCCCKPRACHGDILKACIEWLQI